MRDRAWEGPALRVLRDSDVAGDRLGQRPWPSPAGLCAKGLRVDGLSAGATPFPPGGKHYGVWAPEPRPQGLGI